MSETSRVKFLINQVSNQDKGFWLSDQVTNLMHPEVLSCEDSVSVYFSVLEMVLLLSFFFPFYLFIYFLLYNIVLVLPYINMNPPWVYTCSPSWPRPTSLPIWSLWVIPVHQPQASCILHRTWTGNSFLIWYFTWFNAILQNHPTLSLSHRVQKTVLYICVS